MTKSNNDPWQVTVQNVGGGPNFKVSLEEIKALPKIDQITRFCCIEGWSVVSHFSGARFSDFTRRYFPPGQPLPKYVYMATPSGEYYVGLDMKSAMHPQTLLAYEKDGKPLDDDHGAPLRLIIPVKYGIKNIKRLGLIQYTNKLPRRLLGQRWLRLVCRAVMAECQILCRNVRLRLSQLEARLLSQERLFRQVPLLLCDSSECGGGELHLSPYCDRERL